MNSVNMTGSLTRQPKLEHIKKKRAVCEIRLAVDNGRYPTTFITVRVFDAPAYACAEFLSRGSAVRVEGELAFRERNSRGIRLHEPHSIVGRVTPLRPSGRDGEKTDQPDSEPVGATEPTAIVG